MYVALGDPHRLAIIEELALSDRAPSELRPVLGIEANLLSHHLAVLEDAGLIERVVSDGDRRRRYLRLRQTDVADALSIDAVVAANIVFVCTRNSARSQLAAALWNAAHPVPASSAGTHPAERVHPFAVQAGAAAGVDLNHATPRRLDQLGLEPDLVVTVCDRAHEELGEACRRRLHWSLPDPAVDGRRRSFESTVQRLLVRIGSLAPIVQAA
jgi:protein-tyrosine-phosphatase